MATITGTDQVDTLAGTPDDDEISALGGHDSIRMSVGRDTIDGGPGVDILSGFAAEIAGLPTTSRSYTLADGRFSDASGVIDTRFSNIEFIEFLDYSGVPVTFDASGYSGNSQLFVGQ